MEEGQEIGAGVLADVARYAACPRCGGKWRPWWADGVGGRVCENGCVSEYLPPPYSPPHND